MKLKTKSKFNLVIHKQILNQLGKVQLRDIKHTSLKLQLLRLNQYIPWLLSTTHNSSSADNTSRNRHHHYGTQQINYRSRIDKSVERKPEDKGTTLLKKRNGTTLGVMYEIGAPN